MNQRFFKTENLIVTAMEQSTEKASKEIKEAINKQMDILRIKLQNETIAPNRIEEIIQEAAKEEYSSRMTEFKEKFYQKIQANRQGGKGV